MSTRHPAIDKWGMKMYGESHNLPEGTQFEIEQDTYYGGYCETCSYEEEIVIVRVKRPGEEWDKLLQRRTDLAEIMREVLDAGL